MTLDASERLDRKRARNKAWYAANRDRVLAQRRAKVPTPEERAAKSEYDRAYRLAHITPEMERERKLKSKYGISLRQYQEMFDAQGGVCAICLNGPGKMGVLAVDHDHSCCPGRTTCGQCVRGLLCWPCNSFLGRIQDSPERLLAYLGGKEVQP